MNIFSLSKIKLFYFTFFRKIYKVNILIHNALFRIQSPLESISILEKNFIKNSNFSFVQIGANDGISHDDLYYFVKERNSKGIVVEPLKDYFQKLSENYKNYPKIIKVNKAIHPNLKSVILYRVDPLKEKELPEFAGGIASLFPDHYQKTKTSKDFIIEEECESINLMDLLTETKLLGDIDYIQIDTEGFDFEILKQIDFTLVKPAIIKYEFDSLSKEDYKASKKLLFNNGYSIIRDICDIIAVDLSKIKI